MAVNGCRIYENIMGKNCRQFRFLKWTSFISQFVLPVRGGWMWAIVILASYKFHFIRVHDNLV